MNQKLQRTLSLLIAALFFSVALSSAAAEDVWTWKDWDEENPDYTVSYCSQPYTDTDSADDPDRTVKVINAYWKVYYNVSTDHGFVINHVFYDADGSGGSDEVEVLYRMFTPWVYADQILVKERIALDNASVESIVVKNTVIEGDPTCIFTNPVPYIEITVKYDLIVLEANVDLDTVYRFEGSTITIRQDLRGHELTADWDVPVFVDFDIGSSVNDDEFYFPTWGGGNKKDNEGFGTVSAPGDAGSFKESANGDRRADISVDLDPDNGNGYPPTNPEAYWLKYKDTVDEYEDHPSNYEESESLSSVDIIYWYLGYFEDTNNGDNDIDIDLVNY